MSTSKKAKKRICFARLNVEHSWTPECDQVDQVTSSWRLYSIAKHGPIEASAHAMANPNLGLWNRKRAFRNSHVTSILFLGLPGLAVNPNLTAEEAEEFASDWQENLVEAILWSRLDLLSEKTIISAAARTSYVLTAPLLNRTDLPEEAYSQLCYSTQYHWEHQVALVKNPSFGWKYVRVILQKAQDPLVIKAALLSPNTPVEFLIMEEELDRHPKVADEAMQVRKVEVEEWLAERDLSLDLPLEWIREVLA